MSSRRKVEAVTENVTTPKIDPGLPVIAVFGPNMTAELGSRAARLLGGAINRLGGVLLTGGDLPTNGYPTCPRPVKDAAIYGADEAGSAEQPATWVGVANTKQAAAAAPRGPASVLLTPGWRDRRNLVEACLCDAAIAVVAPPETDHHGSSISEGTASEALFTLFLGRPLFVVGTNLGDVDLSPKALKKLAITRVQSAGSEQAIDKGIVAAYTWAGVADRQPVTKSLPADELSASDMVAELLELLRQRTQRALPLDLVDEPGWNRYVENELRASALWTL